MSSSEESLASGETLGVGWERSSRGPPGEGSEAPGGSTASTGRVYFTKNGTRISGSGLDDVCAAGLWPVVHIQRSLTKVVANFGQMPFLYTQGRAARAAGGSQNYFCSTVNFEETVPSVHVSALKY